MARPGAIKPAKLAAVALVGALLSFQIIRTAAVVDRQAHPALAARLWRSHPSVLTDKALLEIAKAASHGQKASLATRADVRKIAIRAPLSPDPYVIEGAIAETEGRGEAAERLLLTARDRDPRSRSARFLLADRFLRTGRIAAGLIEMQALVTLQSHGGGAFSPALAAYARTPGAVPQLRAFFAKYPHAEAGILSLLAGDAANADLVMALASDRRSPSPDWRGTLVSALAAAGQYAKAYSTWSELSGVRPARGLFNPGFATSAAPPPFNWQFPQSSEGVAEPDGKGGLDILYYGRAKAVLASQLLLLPAGRYRIAATIGGTDGADAMHWTVRCAQDQKPLADLPVRAGPNSATFNVPDGCEAQWLELTGQPRETPRTSEMNLKGLRLVTEASQ
jgi:hypothetical protein